MIFRETATPFKTEELNLRKLLRTKNGDSVHRILASLPERSRALLRQHPLLTRTLDHLFGADRCLDGLPPSGPHPPLRLGGSSDQAEPCFRFDFWSSVFVDARLYHCLRCHLSSKPFGQKLMFLILMKIFLSVVS